MFLNEMLFFVLFVFVFLSFSNWLFNFFNFIIAMEVAMLFVLLITVVSHLGSVTNIQLSLLVLGASETVIGLTILVSLVRVNNLEWLNTNSCGSF